MTEKKNVPSKNTKFLSKSLNLPPRDQVWPRISGQIIAMPSSGFLINWSSSAVYARSKPGHRNSVPVP